MARQRKSYYDILGVPKDVDAEKLRQAYCRLAVKYHPDKNPNDKIAEEKFREVTEAYEVLKDPAKRHQYNVQDTYVPIYSNYDDLFNIFKQAVNPDAFNFTFNTSPFNNASAFSYRGRRGQDIKITLDIGLDDVLTGAKKVIKYKRYEKCEDCSGLGSKTNDKTTCSKCRGAGKIVSTIRHGIIIISNESICDTCNGLGYSITMDCGACSGKGIVLKENIVDVIINPGITESNDVVMKYYGHCGEHNGISGSLMIKFRIKPHAHFVRQGNDILHDVNIPFTLAALGGKISINTLRGQHEITITPGTKCNQIMTIQKCGLPDFDNPRKVGDHVVRFIVDVPQNLTQKQKQLINELSKEGL